MTAEKKLGDLVAGATEAEPVADRHAMEEAVLATVARHGMNAPKLWEAFFRVAWSRSDFASIARALQNRLPGEDAPDLILLRGNVQKAGGVVTDAVLTAVLDGSKVKPVTVAEEYVRIMQGQDRIGRAEDAGREFTAAVEKAKRDGTDPEAAFAALLKDVISLAERKELVRSHAPESEDALGFLSMLEKRVESGREIRGLRTGFPYLDRCLNGLTEGLFILAGAPSTGKTSLAKQIADQVAEAEEVPVMFWTFEQSKEELRIKSLSRLAEVDSRNLANGLWKVAEADLIRRADEKYRAKPGRHLTIIEGERSDALGRIRASAVLAKHRAGGKPVFIVIDYLQIIPAEADAPDNLREKIDATLSELRRMARDLKSPILVISSMNRASYGDGKQRPTMSSMKESGGIEYSADAVIALWRDTEASDKLSKDFNRLTVRVEALVLKNRNGALANVDLIFTPAWSRFDEGNNSSALSYSAALG